MCKPMWKKQACHDDRETSEEQLNIADQSLVMIPAVSYEYIPTIIMSVLTKFPITATLEKPLFH